MEGENSIHYSNNNKSDEISMNASIVPLHHHQNLVDQPDLHLLWHVPPCQSQRTKKLEDENDP